MKGMLRAGAALAALIAGLGLVTPGAQEPPHVTGRRVVSDLTAPAIDQGVRPADAPPIRTSSTGQFGPGTPPGPSYIPGSLIVKFRPGTTLAFRRAMLALIGGSDAGAVPGADFDIIAIDRNADPEAAAARLASQPDVEYAQARYLVRPRFRPNDPLYSLQWHYPALDMERAWDINRGAASSVVVAVLDTGVAYRSALVRFDTAPFAVGPDVVFPSLGTVDVPFAAAPDLGTADRFVAPRDFIWNDTMPLDMDGHGTHVAGTIGQLTNNGLGVAGMAFNVRLMPVKVIAGFWDLYFGSPEFGTDDTVARGIRYAADNGAHVINMSIGRSGPPAPVIESAIRYAVARGAFVVVSAGNDFLAGNPVERTAEFAPSIDGMVAVGATNRNRERAAYSNTGAYVELVAPGGDFGGGPRDGILQQTYNLDLTTSYLLGPARLSAPRYDAFVYLFAAGTSMATAHVSGLAALLVQQGITRPSAIEAVLRQHAIDLGPPGRDDQYGDGLINPRASLRGLGLAR